MGIYLSPFEYLKKISASKFIVMHSNRLVYQYDAENSDPVFLFDLSTLPNAIVEGQDYSTGIAKKGENIYGAVTEDNILYKNYTSIKTSSLNTIYSVFASSAGDSVFIHGTDENEETYQFEEIDVVTRTKKRVITWDGWRGTFVSACSSNNVLLSLFYSDNDPQGALRFWNLNSNSEILSIPLASYYQHDIYTAGTDMLVITSFSNDTIRFHCYNELGVEIGVLIPTFSDIYPTGFLLNCIAITSTNFFTFSGSEGVTFYNTYEIEITRDLNGIPISATLGDKIHTRDTYVYNEKFAQGHMQSQS